jgi:hypothetical protein
VKACLGGHRSAPFVPAFCKEHNILAAFDQAFLSLEVAPHTATEG